VFILVVNYQSAHQRDDNLAFVAPRNLFYP